MIFILLSISGLLIIWRAEKKNYSPFLFISGAALFTLASAVLIGYHLVADGHYSDLQARRNRVASLCKEISKLKAKGEENGGLIWLGEYYEQEKGRYYRKLSRAQARKRSAIYWLFGYYFFINGEVMKK